MDEQPQSPQKSLFPQIEDNLDLYLVKKAPYQIPPQFKELIVKYGPYINLIFMLFALQGLLLLFGLFSNPFITTTLIKYTPTGFYYYFGIAIAIATLVLEALALPGLFKRAKVGWNFMFYATLVSSFSNLVRLDLIGLVVGLLIGLYILFQIRPYYK